VHVGGGRILTCAHVVDARDDEEVEEVGKVPLRVGRLKLVMFPVGGRTFVAECTAATESDGVDVAVLLLRAEVTAEAGAPSCVAYLGAAGGVTASSPSVLSSVLPSVLPAAAAVATEPVTKGDNLCCVGNPSNIDLESLRSQQSTEFTPPAWHTSVGHCEGYSTETKAGCGMLQHSCWTYWGHSGAPLFNESGQVAGLHCAWDDGTGMRQGQALQNLHSVLGAVATEDLVTSNEPRTNPKAKLLRDGHSADISCGGGSTESGKRQKTKTGGPTKTK